MAKSPGRRAQRIPCVGPTPRSGSCSLGWPGHRGLVRLPKDADLLGGWRASAFSSGGWNAESGSGRVQLEQNGFQPLPGPHLTVRVSERGGGKQRNDVVIYFTCGAVWGHTARQATPAPPGLAPMSSPPPVQSHCPPLPYCSTEKIRVSGGEDRWMA